MKRTLVTGAGGQMGTELVAALGGLLNVLEAAHAEGSAVFFASTTDYAVEALRGAVAYGAYTCPLRPDTQLDMMYMPDAIRAATELMQADPSRLTHRNACNITAMQFTPRMLAAEIRRHLPHFRMDYRIDRLRQSIADSCPVGSTTPWHGRSGAGGRSTTSAR